MKQILIIGGGASGIAAAITAARTVPSAHITILEAMDRVGKKILATGNGRCNLGNRELSPAAYHSQDRTRMTDFLSRMPIEKTLDFFSSIGMLCATEEMGRVYPYCRQASMVLDTLLLALQCPNISIECEQKVISLSRSKKGFSAKCESGRVFHAGSVILATGGKAAPKQGSIGIGYELAASLGHRCTKLAPCLVALKSDHTALKGLKGIRAHCTSNLYINGDFIAAEPGEVQFTDYGLSGIPSMQLSCLLKKGAAEIGIDFFPEMSLSELKSMLAERCSAYPQRTMEDGFLGLINKKLLFAVLKSAHIGPLSRTLDTLTEKEIRRLADHLKDWRFNITGTQGWEQAQVTLGGIPLEEVDDNFQSSFCPGLYLTGELLDVAGNCGGYNLHWAWCSGIIAGSHAVL